MYLERITWGWSRQVGGRRAAAIPVAAGLGAHQPDWRLRLAAEPQAGGREVQAATIARKTLAYDFFRILRAPLHVRPLRFIDVAATTAAADGLGSPASGFDLGAGVGQPHGKSHGTSQPLHHRRTRLDAGAQAIARGYREPGPHQRHAPSFR